jgi:hypothetical protein
MQPVFQWGRTRNQVFIPTTLNVSVLQVACDDSLKLVNGLINGVTPDDKQKV